MWQRTKSILYGISALSWTLIGSGADLKTQPDRVMYISFQPGSRNIYLFPEQGRAPKRLTLDPGLEYDPVVSPDGRWLVFTSDRRGNPDLYALDLQRGGEPRLLVDSERMEDQAAFSPDGKFSTLLTLLSGNADIYRLPFSPRQNGFHERGRKSDAESCSRIATLNFAARPCHGLQLRPGTPDHGADSDDENPIQRDLDAQPERRNTPQAHSHERHGLEWFTEVVH